MKNQYAFRTNAVWARLNADFKHLPHDQIPEIPPHLAQIVEAMTDEQARAGLHELFNLYSFPTDAQFVQAMKWAVEQKRPPVATTLPDDWQPIRTHELLARLYGLVLIPEAAKFRDFHLAQGTEICDWNYEFSDWLYGAWRIERDKQ